MSTTFTTDQIAVLMAAGIDLNEFFAAGDTQPAPPAPVAEPMTGFTQWGEISAHVYGRRMHRFETTERGGLTSKQRKGLAAELRADLGREYTAEEWDAAVGYFKAELARLDAR